MSIEIFDNLNFPTIMTARKDGKYPMVHAVLNTEYDPPRLVVSFQSLWSVTQTQEDVKEVRDELIRAVFESFGQHNLFFELDDGLYKIMEGSPYQIMNNKKKTGMMLIFVEER